MVVVWSPRHRDHRPLHEQQNGRLVPNLDTPERLDALVEALAASALPVRLEKPPPLPEAELLRVHDPDYVAHTRQTCARLGPAEEWFPTDLEAEHSLDASAPLFRETHACALAAAGCAARVAHLLLSGEPLAYALCRPPGHHADRRRRGGVCYYNNAALAADLLSCAGRVAVLDLDLHYGNGTIDILQSRPEVRLVSIHASTEIAYPFAAGGSSAASIPLSADSGDGEFLDAVDDALTRLAAFSPAHLVVSIGYDGHIDDPDNDVLQLTDAAFAGAGERLAALRVPTALIQEGGYNPATIGRLSACFCQPLTGAV